MCGSECVGRGDSADGCYAKIMFLFEMFAKIVKLICGEHLAVEVAEALSHVALLVA